MVIGFIDALTSREQAVLIWTAAGLVYAISKEHDILGAFAATAGFLIRSWKLLVLYGSAGFYAALLVLLGHHYHLWHTSSAKETVYWFLGTGLVLAGNAADLTRKPHFLRELVLKVLGVGFLTLVVEFVANYYTFHLVIELVLTFLIFVAVVVPVAATGPEPEHVQVRAFCHWMLALLGIGLITITLGRALGDIGGVATRANGEAILISPAFTLAFVPFLYAWGLVIGYEHVFVRVGHLEERRPYPRGVRWAVFRACGLRLGQIRRFTQTFTARLFQLQAQEDVAVMIEDFHAHRPWPDESAA